MISDPIKFQVGKMEIDVNWSPEVTPCKLIRFKFDGKEEIIERNELYSLMMLFGNDKQQEDLIPNPKKRIVVEVKRLLHVRAKKELKAGELMSFPFTYTLSKEDYDALVKENPRAFREATEKVLEAPDLSTSA